jgi:hypothetical protein
LAANEEKVNHRLGASLSDEEHQLPVGEIVNLAALLDRLRTGWSPARYHSPG